jgi:Zn-dependent peptidase ImmA (M78 family)
MADDNLRVQLLTARWSEKDLERMKALHASGGMNAIFKAFPKRSASAIHQKALKLGLRIRAKWTSRDDRLLRNFWGDLTVRDIANRFGRTEVAVCFRAKRLGLKLGRPQGWAFLSSEAKRIGITSDTLRKLLVQSGARIVPTWNIPMKARGRGLREGRPMLVDPYDVDLATEKYLDEETLNAAAIRRGTSAETLRKRLKAIGVVPPKSLQKYSFWRIPSADIDRALAEHAQTKASHDALYENLKEAAARSGVSREALVARFKKFKVKYEPQKVLKTDVDKVNGLIGKRESDKELLNATIERLGTSRQVIVEWLKAAGTPHLAGHLDVETFRKVVLQHEGRWELRGEDEQHLRDCAKELNITHTAFVARLRTRGVEYRIGMLDRDKLREVIAEGQKAIADQALLVASAARIGTPVSLLLFNLRKRGFAYLAGELDLEQVEAVVRVLLHRKRDRELLKSAAQRARRSMSHFANTMRAKGYDPRIGYLVPEDVEATARLLNPALVLVPEPVEEQETAA